MFLLVKPGTQSRHQKKLLERPSGQCFPGATPSHYTTFYSSMGFQSTSSAPYVLIISSTTGSRLIFSSSKFFGFLSAGGGLLCPFCAAETAGACSGTGAAPFMERGPSPEKSSGAFGDVGADVSGTAGACRCSRG